MERTTRKSAYRLTWEFDHLESCDEEYDLEIHEFERWSETSRLMKVTPYDLPDPVVFYTDFELLACTDFPVNNVNWPIMSRRMHYILKSVGDFSHRVIPLAIIHDRFTDLTNPPQLFLDNGQPNPKLTNFNDYVAVQLLEESNFFDFKNSEYEPDSDFPEWVKSVEKYELNEPSGGYPPLFRLAADAVSLFISEKARQALSEAGIRGTAYYTLDDGYSLQDEVDIPVEL
jgi:hypothetical protein